MGFFIRAQKSDNQISNQIRKKAAHTFLQKTYYRSEEQAINMAKLATLYIPSNEYMPNCFSEK